MTLNQTGKRLAQRGSLPIYITLIVVVFTMFFPFFWMVSTSVKSNANILIYPPQLFPNELQLSNFQRVFQLQPMGNALLNSILNSTIATAGTLLSSSLAA